jgi:hypothetical protein
MGRGDRLVELLAGAVLGSDATFLVELAEVPKVVGAVTDVIDALCLGRRWQPEGAYTGVSQRPRVARHLVP